MRNALWEVKIRWSLNLRLNIVQSEEPSAGSPIAAPEL